MEGGIYMPARVGIEYGVARISTKKQSIDRQIRNILADYPNAVVIKETYTGTRMQRKKRVWKFT